jgi:hypothetical protein
MGSFDKAKPSMRVGRKATGQREVRFLMRSIPEIRNFMERQGIPGRDLYELPDSERTFPEGANYRIEIAGVERATTMEAMIDEAKKRNITIHRAIATVGGSTFCDFQELKAMAQMAYEEKIEVVMTIGHRKTWDPGSKEASTPEGMMHGFRLRGSDNISYWIADMMRNIEAGFRGFLVYDEGSRDYFKWIPSFYFPMRSLQALMNFFLFLPAQIWL